MFYEFAIRKHPGCEDFTFKSEYIIDFTFPYDKRNEPYKSYRNVTHNVHRAAKKKLDRLLKNNEDVKIDL